MTYSWTPPKRTLCNFVISNARPLSRNALRNVVNSVKARMLAEGDDYKRQCWAEVGIELNRMLMQQ